MKKLKEAVKKLLERMRVKDNVLDYICGSEALPLPYSAEEESELLGELSLGNEKVKSDLVEHNLRLVVYMRASSTIRAPMPTTSFRWGR